MKTVVAVILILMLVLSGCNKAIVQNEVDPSAEASVESAEDTEYSDSAEIPIDNNDYDPEKIVFVAESDADDADVYYCFNRLGELIETTDTYPKPYSSGGLYPAKAPNGKVGFADQNGLFVIEPIYEYATPFRADGYSRVVKALDEGDCSGTEKHGVINDKGEEIIDCKYDELTDFHDNGFCLGTIYTDPDDPNAGVRYVLDKSGKVCFESSAPMLEINENYIVERNNGIFVIYDYDGNMIYTQDQADLKGDVSATTTYKEITVTDEYVGERVVYKFVEGALKKVSRYIYVDYEAVSYESESFCAERVMSAKTETGYAWAFDEFDIPPEYDSFWIDGDRIILQKNEPGELYDFTSAIYDIKKGNIINNVPYTIDERAERLDGYYYISNKDGRGSEGWCVGIADKEGNVIIEPIYERIELFE